MAFYKNNMITAKENDELAEWRASFKENCNCAKAIDKALNDNYANNRLDTDKALDTVLAEYGTDRVIHVLAAQVVNHDWDGRYHKDVKEWAKEQTKDLSAEFMEDSRDYYLNAHPILIDGLATKVIQRGFEMSNFLSDPEKMYDFKILSKEEFLASYSYLTEAEYDNTVKEVAIEIHNFYDEFTDEIMEEMSVEDIVAEMENDGVPATLENYIGDIKDWQKSFEGELSHKEIEASNDLLRFLSLPQTENFAKSQVLNEVSFISCGSYEDKGFINAHFLIEPTPELYDYFCERANVKVDKNADFGLSVYAEIAVADCDVYHEENFLEQNVSINVFYLNRDTGEKKAQYITLDETEKYILYKQMKEYAEAQGENLLQVFHIEPEEKIKNKSNIERD